MIDPRTVEARRLLVALADALNRLRGDVADAGDVEAVADSLWHCHEAARCLDDVGPDADDCGDGR